MAHKGGRGQKLAPYDKKFGNTKANVTKNGGQTTTGMGIQMAAPTRAKKVSSKHK